MTTTTPADHIAHAKEWIDLGRPDHAIAHALIAIAETINTNRAETYAAGVLTGATVGTEATAEALTKISKHIL